MGVSLSWIAFKDQAPSRVRGLLSLSPTGKLGHWNRSKFGAASLGPWHLVCIRGCGHRFVRKADLEKLSADGEVLAVSVEEHVMASSAELWRHGKQAWAVSHPEGVYDADGLPRLIEAGSLPAAYAEIKARLCARQREEGRKADYLFDAPLELAMSLTGFKHDVRTETEFEELRAESLFARLFRKRETP